MNKDLNGNGESSDPIVQTYQISAADVSMPSRSSTTSPSLGNTQLAQFDTNSNGVIDNQEFFKAMDDWVLGKIDDSTFFRLTDAWISQSSVRTAVASKEASIALRSNGDRGVIFEVSGEDVTSLGVVIYDLNGHQIFTQETSGARILWKLRSSTGQRVANGVYFYIVTTRDTEGQIVRNEIKKLAVMR